MRNFITAEGKTADTLNDLNEKCRYDALGNEISKRSKKQKVTFVDNLSSKKIVEIIEYDEYSIVNKCNKDNVNCECRTCIIF